MQKINSFDVAIIGGGPAGMMAAIRGAELGASVVLMEKNAKLGKKLLITGGGRCNVTNATFDNRELAKKYKGNGKFLLSPLSRWNSENTIKFFEQRGVPVKTENDGRVFPQSDSSESIKQALVKELVALKVTILLDSPVLKISHRKNRIIEIQTSDKIITAKNYIIATGGKARPETGSTGEGFSWLAKFGHTVITPDLALVPVKISEHWVKKLQGLSLPNIKITLIENGNRNFAQTGKVLFAHFGMTGPLVLNMSGAIREAMKESAVSLSLDLFPDLDQEKLDLKFREHLTKVQNKKWQNALKGFVPPLLASVLIELSHIDPELFVNKIPREARISFVKLLKELLVTPSGFLGAEKAIVSSGGVDLTEINFKTMNSLKVENLYLAGDILNFNRPSGGFSLQICWTTGFVAGENAALSALSNRQ